MAVVRRDSGINNRNASAASTTVTWFVPSGVGEPFTGDIWICYAVFRGGSTATISGVPGSFTLIGRVNSGSASTNAVAVAYWYQALGTETAGTSFASITISGSSKYVTETMPFGGVDTTNPIQTSQTGSGTTSAVSATLAAVPTGNMISGFSCWQGSTFTTGNASGSAGTNLTDDGGLDTTGGSAATNVGEAVGWVAGSVASQTYTSQTLAGASTACIIVVALAATAVAATAPQYPIVIPQAVKRASIW